MMIIEGIIVGRDFVSFWQTNCVVFHEPHGAGLSACTFEDEIGLSGASR
jgi:hypothetical protein